MCICRNKMVEDVNVVSLLEKVKTCLAEKEL